MNRPWMMMFSATASALLAGEAALVEPMQGFVGRFGEGTLLYSDRGYQMYAPPAELNDVPYCCTSINGGVEVKVIRGGKLLVVTPMPPSSLSQAPILEGIGFTRVTAIEPFQPHSSNPADICGVWQKTMAAGEAFTLGKWAIIAGFDISNQNKSPLEQRPQRVQKAMASLKGTPYAYYAMDIPVNLPDYVVFLPKQSTNPEKRRVDWPGDTYNDHFQVIYKEQTDTLFAFWTQATRESDIDQHIAFSKSTDHGDTWTPPEILAGSPNKKHPALLASWQQPMISKSGRIYCLWNQQTTSRGPHCGAMMGAFSDDDGDTWSAPKMVPFTVRMDADPEDSRIPPSWCNWQRPLRLGEDDRYFVGCSRHGKAWYDKRGGCKIEFWQYNNIDDNPPVEKIELSYFQTNRDALAAPEVNKLEPAVEEASIVKLPDGRLFAVMRSSIGYPVWSQSRDHGHTWSAPKELRDHDGGTRFLHPRSPCPIYDWKGCEAASGTYFCLVHNTFDFNGDTAYQPRGPLYLLAGKFNPNAVDQPVEFAEPKLFAPREGGNSFYTSYTYFNGKGILWFPDKKFYLLGREIDASWFE